MELGLSLGGASKPFASGFMDKSRDHHHLNIGKGLGFCMGLSIGSTAARDDDEEDKGKSDDDPNLEDSDGDDHQDPPLQLDLLPNTPVPRYPHGFPWPSSGSSEAGSSGQMAAARGVDINRAALAEEEAVVSSPNSAASSFQMDLWRNGAQKRDCMEGETERASSRASDEDENGNSRKKLRLSKEQSAFLEESFKEHSTLNPKQKLALAKQLNLRPRQVEVWFQNRRARTKLKQTEVDCEYLKRCCETLTEENRRLHKELQELRALKTSNPYCMQLPATTLTMCPSCERVATNTNTTAAATTTTDRPRLYPFAPTQNHHQSKA